MGSRLHLVVVGAVVVAAVGPLALPSSAAACPGVTSIGRWSSIELPPVPVAVAGASTPADGISSYAVAVGRPKLLYAAGGRQVFRSRDGGCSWQVAVSLDTAGSATAPSRLDPAYTFVNVIVPAGVPGAKTVYALATDWTSTLTVNPPVLLAVSRDDGATWRLSEPSAVALVPDYPRCSSGFLIAGADPQAVYLSCPSSSFVEGAATLGLVRCWPSFYVSRDDGTSWTGIEPGVAAPCPSRRWSSAGAEPATVADPRSPGWLWGLRAEVIGGSTAQRLMLSTDDGRTVKDLSAAPDPSTLTPRGMAVYAPAGGGPRRIAVYVSGVVSLSDDDGVTVQQLPAGKTVTAAFFDTSGQVLYGGVGDRWNRFDLQARHWQAQPPVPAAWPTVLSQHGSDSAVPLGLYALAAPSAGAPPDRLLVFR